MMRPPILFLAASLAALGIGLVIVPRPLERVTMLTRDRQFEAALELVNEFVDAGEARPELLMQAFALNERYGDLPRAKEAIETYLTLRPDDIEAWKKAAWLYTNSHRSALLMEALENVVRLTGDVDVSLRLSRLYRLHGRYDDELRILQAINLDEVAPEVQMRLATLLVAKGHRIAAADVLRRMDATLAIDVRDPRLLLFSVLVDNGDIGEATGRALGWLHGWQSADTRATMVRHLLRAGAGEGALLLASRADGAREPEVFAYLLDVLSQEGRLHLLPDLLVKWIQNAHAMQPVQLDLHLEQVVAVAAERGLQAQLYRYLGLALQRHDQPELQAGVINALFERFGYAAVMPYRSALSRVVLESRPVLAARLLAAEGNPLAARHFLRRARLDDVSNKTSRDWLSVAQIVLSPAELLHELVSRARADELPRQLKREVLDRAMRMGSGERLLGILTSTFPEEGSRDEV